MDTFAEANLAWLLDPADPGPRYLALRDLLRLSADDPELSAVRREAHTRGPIAEVLSHMHPDGWWVEPGAGYLPKYTSTVWSLVLLAQLGASLHEDERISNACAYALEHTLAPGGQFSTNRAPSGTADCLQGNLCWALTVLSCTDPRLEAAYDWMARSVTGEGIAPMTERNAAVRYYAGKCGPLFACGANNKLPCAWGAAKVMLAFSLIPEERRTPQVRRAVEQGAEFLLAGRPAEAGYPNGWAEKPSSNWWKFGFPVFYITDILQVVEALAGLGYGADPRLQPAVELILHKRDGQGRWALEYDYAGKTWGSFGDKKQPSKWVTLRALRALHRIAAQPSMS